MITIDMEDERDAKGLYRKLTRCADIRKRNVRFVETRILIETKIISSVASVLTDFVIAQEEEAILRHLIADTFYFRDPDEQQQILEITQSIIQGEKPNLPGLKKISSRRRLLFTAFTEFLTESPSFHYSSFIRFRLKPYRLCLEQYVEMAIDEYKLEQEYQNFVENLRTLLSERPCSHETVHLVFRREFALYDKSFQRIDEFEVRNNLSPRLKKGWGMDIEPSVLVTLIGLAPKKIYLYTNQLDAGMVKTIQNVFQERVMICSEHSCHFHS